MEVSPFQGICYNQRIVGDLAHILCPPYDVISPGQQRVYYDSSDYNAIRLELAAESLEPTGDTYQRTAITFQQWLKQGVLQTDNVPSFYLHDHLFEYSSQKMVRRGLIARVRLERWAVVYILMKKPFPKLKATVCS